MRVFDNMRTVVREEDLYGDALASTKKKHSIPLQRLSKFVSLSLLPLDCCRQRDKKLHGKFRVYVLFNYSSQIAFIECFSRQCQTIENHLDPFKTECI